MSLIGTLSEFDGEQTSWSSWVERLEQYFSANAIPDNRQVAVFLTVVGAKTYDTLRDLLSPVKPAAKTLAELLTLLENHFQPKPLEIAERFCFYQRQQQTGEEIKVYVLALRRLASTCSFGDYLPTALRDKFVMGLNCESTQKRLLTEKDLTLTKAIEIASVMEMAVKDTEELNPQSRREEVKQEVFRTAVKPTAANWKYRPPPSRESACYRCGNTDHDHKVCRFKDQTCHNCGRTGHLKRVCRSKKVRDKQPLNPKTKTYMVGRYTSSSESEDEEVLHRLDIHHMHSAPSAMTVDVTVEGKKLRMDVDTGAAVSVITQKQWRQLQTRKTVRPTPIKLQTYSKQILHPLGYAKVKVLYKGQTKRLPLYILENGGPPLFGRDWIAHFGMPDIAISPCNTVTIPLGDNEGWVVSLKQRFPKIFDDQLGKIKHDCVRLKLKPNAQPKFFKARTVPFALRAGVEAELSRLEEQGVISKVEHSEWASPVVPVKKANGDLRICGDFRMALNSQLEIDQYPLPRVDDIFASLAGGQKFTKLDLKQAYLQFEVHPSSRKFLTINTHKGLYEYNRMVFGVASAPAIWQRKMDEILADIPFTQCLLDDMLITGRTDQEHKQNVELVLARLQEQGLKVNLAKCQFMVPKLEFCGHLVDAEGIHTTEAKVDALVKAPAPTNVQQLRSYLGLLNYYHKFLPDLAHTLFPLNKLLEKHSRWDWSAACQRAFEVSKRKLLASRMLVHYDLQKPLTLACDASPYGLGAVLSHILPDGSEKTVAFASRSLTKAESNYSHIDKEALALIWAIKKFHLYLYGREFTILTDHKPLLQIFSPDKGISQTTAARLQRYALFLGAYSYRIQYRGHDANANADAMSRLTGRSMDSSPPVKSCRYTSLSFLSSGEIAAHTTKDTFLKTILSWVRSGWPATVTQEYEPYFRRRMELTVAGNCVLWGDRVIIPQTLRRHILDLLHTGHPGGTRMKQKARGYVWWPNLDSDITTYVNACAGCAQTARDPPRGCVQPWTWPTVPWFRLHLDFAGPIRGHTFLIIVDAHSKWPEVIPVTQPTTKATVSILLHLAATFGYPREIVTDNGAQFTSQEFQRFLTAHNIKHKLTAPYHPATNGQAERFVQTFKRYFKATVAASKQQSLSPQQLDSFLSAYRNTPHATTGKTPAELLLGRQPWTVLDMLRPQTVQEHVLQSQDKMVKHNELPRFTAQQKVWARSYGASNTRWLPAVIAETLGPKMYKVRLEDGSICRRHADQLRPRSQLPESLMPAEPPVSQGSAPSESGRTETDDCGDSELLNSAPTEPSSSGPEVCLPSELGDPFLALPVPIPASPVSSGPESLDARPQRHCRPPDRFQLQERLRDFRRGRRK